MGNKRFFTLLELMIVIAIIAILAAILLPSLFRAKYMAELVVCTNNLKQYATAVNLYAINNTMEYPYMDNQANSRIIKTGSNDARPMLKPYIEDINFLNCPFSPLGHIDQNTATTNKIGTTYEHWYGMKLNSSDESAMWKVADQKLTATAKGETNDFSVLISDADRHSPNNTIKLLSAMPASDLEFYEQTNRSSTFWNSKVAFHNTMDRNFIFTDGHAELFTDLFYEDERLAPVPYGQGGMFGYLPPD